MNALLETGLMETSLAQTAILPDKLLKKSNILEENELVLIKGFDDTTPLEDLKGLTGFPLNRWVTVLNIGSLIRFN